MRRNPTQKAEISLVTKINLDAKKIATLFKDGTSKGFLLISMTREAVAGSNRPV